MTWSTRELAHLAGTTVNTVRHYHTLGLLDEPQRGCNGYKQYRVHHLVRLLRVRRLADLGIPLAQIGTIGPSGLTQALGDLDAALQDEIERSRRARADIATILRAGAPADTPRGFESVAARLSDADRALIHICTRLYDQDALSDLQRMVAAEPGAISEEFGALTPDADEVTRERIAERIVRDEVNWRSADRSWLCDAAGRMHVSRQVTKQTYVAALTELYNAAQRDVLARADVAARERVWTPSARLAS